MIQTLSKSDESYRITAPRSSTNSKHKKTEQTEQHIPRRVLIKLHETSDEKPILKAPGEKDTEEKRMTASLSDKNVTQKTIKATSRIRGHAECFSKVKTKRYSQTNYRKCSK